MKYCSQLIILFLCLGCSSFKLTEAQLNPDFSEIQLKKVLVIGVSPLNELREQFEFQFVRQLNAKGIVGLQSAVQFTGSFKNSTQVENEMLAQIDLLRSKGFDAIIVTLIKDVDEYTSHSGGHVKFDYYLRQFSSYYAMFRSGDYDKNYDDAYRVYTVETSIYALQSTPELGLVWSGSYDFVNPDGSHKTMGKFIKTVLKTLTKEKLID